MVLHRIWPKGPFTQRLWEPKDPGTALGACLLGLQKNMANILPMSPRLVGTWWPTALTSPIRDTRGVVQEPVSLDASAGGLDSRIGT